MIQGAKNKMRLWFPRNCCRSMLAGRIVRFLYRACSLPSQIQIFCEPSLPPLSRRVEEQEGLNPSVAHGDGWPLVCNDVEGVA